MSKFNCWICGKEHDYCPTCEKTHGWKYVACCHEHYQIHMAIEEYRSGVLSKEEVTKMLDGACGVKAANDLSWMLPHVEKGIREIIGEKPVIIKKDKKNK